MYIVFVRWCMYVYVCVYVCVRESVSECIFASIKKLNFFSFFFTTDIELQ